MPSSPAPTPAPPPQAPKMGRLIAFEGVGDSGRCVYARLLAVAWGAEFVQMYPYRSSAVGKIVYEEMQNEARAFSHTPRMRVRIMEAMLIANALEAHDEIVDHLLRGRDVVVDRYVPSYVVTQNLYADVPPDVLKSVEHEFMGMPRADVVLYMDGPENDTAPGYPEMRKKIRERYDAAYASEMVRIDATGDAQHTSKQCYDAIGMIERRDALTYY